MPASYYFAFGLDITRADVISILILACLIYVLTPLLVVLAATWSFYLFKRYAKHNLSPTLLRFNKVFSIALLILVIIAGLVEVLFGSDRV